MNTDRLFHMLRHMRPARGPIEERFINKFIDPIPGMKQDSYGNRYLRVGNSKTMFSSHTDTVHRHDGMQKLLIDPTFGDVFADSVESNCLGADCGAGVAVMVEMIEAGVPGLYVFHRDEEIGGGGSSSFAKAYEDMLQDLQRCIAFDRKGKGSVVTHQMGGRCCSNEFATELSRLLSCPQYGFEPDRTGVFTDSANYTHLISECTNLSVGYERQHTKDESLNFQFLKDFTRKCIHLNWEALPAVRDPAADREWGFYGGRNSWWDEEDLGMDAMPSVRGALMTRMEVEELVWGSPDDAVELICDLLGV